ncbi:beta-1,6-N-acetylglucosaminyltransferase [Pedobacter sp. Du54]|uniref:beta-1,6-N-acetylglucosaminyltransferase n=1 Tax=Pedobacter anseongensis TaxID=3133439 RepID=UPI0030AB70BF
MKVSYLILAHGDLVHLERLIEELSDENCRIYIHLDKRVVCPAHLQEKSRVFFIPDPLQVYWGGFSTVEALLKLMRYAIRDRFGDYYTVISGSDFPVKSKSEFYAHLKQGGEFMSIQLADQSRRSLRYLFYHFEKFDRRKYWHPYNAFFHLLETIIKLITTKRKPPFKLYYGPVWFILSKRCMRYVLEKADRDKYYTEFFKNTLCSDEAFFHSIIGNSPFLQQARPNLTFTYWPSKLAPGKITEKQIDIIKNNTTFTGMYGTFTPFFARKFDDHSTEVIAYIKKKLL